MKKYIVIGNNMLAPVGHYSWVAGVFGSREEADAFAKEQYKEFDEDQKRLDELCDEVTGEFIDPADPEVLELLKKWPAYDAFYGIMMNVLEIDIQ